jgi:hypothetical protein
VADVRAVRAEHPGAEVMVHPETSPGVQAEADFIGSTSQMLRRAGSTPATTVIVGTEVGLIPLLQRAAPAKRFVPASPYLVCPDMKMITLEQVEARSRPAPGGLIPRGRGPGPPPSSRMLASRGLTMRALAPPQGLRAGPAGRDPRPRCLAEAAVPATGITRVADITGLDRSASRSSYIRQPTADGAIRLQQGRDPLAAGLGRDGGSSARPRSTTWLVRPLPGQRRRHGPADLLPG